MSRLKLLLLFCIFACLGFAQEYRATLTGRVIDAQGAVIPGVKVLAVNQDTGARSETTSGADGQYTIPFLAPGHYAVTAEVPGFKKYNRPNLTLSTGERQGLDITMEVGEVTESLNVTAEAPLLETSTASTGQVITERQVENMPLNGRTPLVLAQLAMGVIPNSDPKFNRPFDNAGPSGFSMGGAPAQQNELLIDGAPDTTANLRVAYNPPVDSVQEVRVHAFEADAAYGHTGGGTANVVLKSGTNQVHGTAYEFNQTSALAATPFFLNRSGQKNPVTRFNQWGINAGGPFWIPKVFNGRNKVFWYFAWEGINDSFPEPQTESLPTAAERQGDFSALLKLGNQYQLYDPLTGVTQGSRIARQPFPGNIIPSNRLSPVTQAYLKNWIPLPNQNGSADGRDNYVANSVRSDTFNNELGRLDFNFGDRNKMFWDIRHNDRIENRDNLFNNIITGRNLGRVNVGTTVDDVHTFGPTTVLDLRLNYTRFVESTQKFSDGYNYTTLGFPSYMIANSQRVAVPKISGFNGFPSLSTDNDGKTPDENYQIFSDVVKILGKHSLKIGADLRLYRQSSLGFANANGNFSFATNWTRGPLDNATSAPYGQELASFLLGLPTGGSYDINAARTNKAGYYAFFVQDDYRATSTLTLNVGLRYDHDMSTTERYNRTLNGFDLTTPNPIAAAAMAAYAKNPIAEIPASQFKVLGGPLFASSQNPDIYHTKSHYFSPRLGFAWSPSALGGKVAIRGGYGVFVFPFGTAGVNQPGFSASSSVVPSLNSFLTPYATLSNPFPDGIQFPTGSSLGLATFLGKDITFYNPHPLNPYSQRWDFSIQRELGANMVVEVGYIGNHAVHLPAGSTFRNTGDTQLNYVPGQYLSTSRVRDQATIDRLTANVPNPFAGLIPGTSLNGTTVSRSQLLMPFPEFGRINLQNNPAGSSYFHNLNVRVEKRYSHGFNLLFNYAWSKLIERTRYLNDFDPAPEKRVSADDRPQRVVISSSYDLPFGKGKAFFGSANGFVSRIVGGWVLNGIYTYQRGAPLTWGNDAIYLGGPLNPNPRNVDRAFDVTQFVRASSQQLANEVRTFPTRFGNLRQDGANNFDFSLLKNTYFTERVYFQLRLEAFNAMNHPEFDAPNVSPTSSSFGKITNQPNLARNIQIGARLVW